jgi:Protein of unknown function (DUF3631)
MFKSRALGGSGKGKRSGIPAPVGSERLAGLLKPYGIPRNNTVRWAPKTAKGYRAKDFAEAWSRYSRAMG